MNGRRQVGAGQILSTTPSIALRTGQRRSDFLPPPRRREHLGKATRVLAKPPAEHDGIGQSGLGSPLGPSGQRQWTADRQIQISLRRK